MQLSLKSTNHNREHKFTLVVRDKELIFTTPDGDEICSITVQTMEDDRLGKAEPTSNFWLVFDAPDVQLDKNIAEAIVESIV